MTAWGAIDLGDCHPDLRAIMPSIVTAADKAGLDVRRQSGARSNARQAQLYETYLLERSKFERGERDAPLPAAPPGKSAHNYALCVRHPEHRIGGAVECPLCGAATIPASLALDVSLHDAKGDAIHCPSVPLPERPAAWQTWAGVLDSFSSQVRDGGDFTGRRDVVHLELLGWNVLDHTYQGGKP